MDLASRIAAVPGLLPDHVVSARSQRGPVALLDGWSRVHPIAADAVVGRERACALAIFQESVSRRHAVFTSTARGWAVADLGSRNGTFVDGVRLTPESPVVLAHAQIVTFGEVGFVFVRERAALPAPRAADHGPTAEARRPVAELRLSRPNSEGAGLVSLGPASTSLGSTQFALLRLLAERAAIGDPDDELRGYVRSIELITSLPWNTAAPEDNHVKQQVRRLRRALAELGLPHAIESRHGFGYRLIVPAVVA